ncbi:LysM peptidoglycan-binding domain-containing protein [Ramlibacter sp.]|uniref:LysM peptidoglycan-binding domain-containing protein n=1 Tax=Ramlibacter sp. TaxID=1917967 RepID=UPI001798F49E|nr:LysM peptidoglycan-binding domain-containing protein [Ramlibacter sp.]MBA2673082.1 LysM peptidoglycan-binding domain-containing protein [Ramlibacter sp.]
MVHPQAARVPRPQALALWAASLALAGGLAAAPAAAQAQATPRFPVTPTQRSTAEQVAQAGIPLSELAPNAPDSYTVKRGDTLWAISSVFLQRPWRWPELWGMNIEQIRNPHLIFPGQQLFLEKINGRARLRMGPPVADGQIPTETIRVSPRTRYGTLADAAIPTLPPHLIEPFLSEPLIVAEGEMERAPRLVATQDTRVLITRGDRAYAIGRAGTPLVESDPRRYDEYRVFRNAVPLKDPITEQVLGYEAKYLGKAQLVRSETVQAVRSKKGSEQVQVPATLDIVAAREEMRAGDRLLPEPPRELTSYVPRAPTGAVEGSIVSVYGDAVNIAGQNQVVVINKGTADGLQIGHVLAILKDGARIEDRTQAGERVQLKVPDERNGLMMVFRPFERLSYALILEIGDTVKVGDRVVNPR